jgi:hypothetical protein
VLVGPLQPRADPKNVVLSKQSARLLFAVHVIFEINSHLKDHVNVKGEKCGGGRKRVIENAGARGEGGAGREPVGGYYKAVEKTFGNSAYSSRSRAGMLVSTLLRPAVPTVDSTWYISSQVSCGGITSTKWNPTNSKLRNYFLIQYFV